MNERIEKWVESSRWETGVVGFPRLDHLERLVERCDPWLQVVSGPVTGCMHLPATNQVEIAIAHDLDQAGYEVALAEELGHALFTHGLAAAIRHQRPVLAQANERRDEAIARAFREAWFLPASLVLAYWYQPTYLRWMSGRPWQWVKRRRDALWPLALPDASLPAWLDPPAWAMNLEPL